MRINMRMSHISVWQYLYNISFNSFEPLLIYFYFPDYNVCKIPKLVIYCMCAITKRKMWEACRLSLV